MNRLSKRAAALLAASLLVVLLLARGMASEAARQENRVLLPTLADPGPSATVAPIATATTTAAPIATATATTPAATPTQTPVGRVPNYNILVGPGYTDVSPKALTRTTGNRLYIVVSTCANYPCTAVDERLRVYRADRTGVPGGFTAVGEADAPDGVSQWAAAIDGGNVIHVVWNDRPSSGADVAGLRYATFSTSSDRWSTSIEMIEGSLGLNLDGGGQGMQSVALALDSGGAPHIVYLKGSGPSRRVLYRTRTAAGWSAPTQLDSAITYSNNQKAWHPNLAFDTGGRLLTVWERGSFNGDNDGTIFSRVREANGTWGVAINVSGDNAARVIIDQSTSLLVTPNNRYHVTWIAAATDYIRYQYSENHGATWSANHPGGGTQATHNPSLGYAAGKLRIYGHGTPNPLPDGHGDDLFFFEGEGGAAVWSNWTKFVTGTNYDSSVNVRWSQYFCNFPNTIDLAYWNDQYPNMLYAGSESKGP